MDLLTIVCKLQLTDGEKSSGLLKRVYFNSKIETIIPPLLGLPLEVLSKYCEEKKKPTFNQFVASNQDKFVQWSIDIAAMKGTTLHGVWFERYRKQLKYEKAKYAKPRKSKYNNLIWNTIMTRVTTRRRLRGDYNEGRLVLLNDASAATTREARRLFENPNNSNSSGDGSNSGPSESTSPNSSEQNNNHDEDGEALDDHEDNDDDDDEQEEYVDNMPLATLAMKKLSNKFKSSDMDTLMNLMKNGDDILSRANNHIIKLISQKHLTEVEEETIKLLLSNAINLLDDTVIACMVNVFSPGQLKCIVGEKQSWVGMDLMTRSEIDHILDNNSGSVSDLLVAIHNKKIELIKEKERGSDLYNLLLVLELVTEYMDINIKDDASETTYYRRFAMVLDFVFKGLKVELKDGEVVSEATQMAMEQNTVEPRFLHSFGRKIDVLINIQDSIIALNSNEWKAKKTQNMKLKQQSKNIRSNCAILNNIYIISNGLIGSIMAMDVIGVVGYLYLLKLKKGVYVATLVGSVFLPSSINELGAFKDTLETLVIWHNFMEDQIKTIKNAELRNNLASTAINLYSGEDEHGTTALPTIFFTPKHKQPKKRTFDEVGM